MKNEIRLNYPRTKYAVLNQKIKENLNGILEEFLNYNEDGKQLDVKYNLNIDYEQYIYEAKITYVFFVSMYTGDIHPIHKICTITYDISTNKIITIDYLKTRDSNFLNTISEQSRNILKSDLRFRNKPNSINMMIDGTKPKIENFRNFAFSKNGLILFFDPSHIAPYSYGNFKILIPYNTFNQTANLH